MKAGAKGATSGKDPGSRITAARGSAAPRSGPALVPVWNILSPDGERLGEDRIRLLVAIEASGCLLDAANACGLSYRTAWSRVRELNALFAKPLVESIQGGQEGGSTRLSPDAARLLALHREAEELFRKAAAQQGLEASDDHALQSFQRKLSMRTSVRNQFPGVVRSVTWGKVHAEVELDLSGGSRIVSQITLSSCKSLGLRPGLDAWALIKSTWVEIATGEVAPKLSARNLLRGTVTAVHRGEVSDEICLQLAGGEVVAAVVPPGATDTLGLRKGAKAWAVFKASSVILAVA